MKVISEELNKDILKSLNQPRSTLNIKCCIEDLNKYDKIHWKTIHTRLETLESENKVKHFEFGNKNKIKMWSKK